MILYRLNKKLLYLQKRFSIDLWCEQLIKKNFKRKKIKIFAIRLERFILLGSKFIKYARDVNKWQFKQNLFVTRNKFFNFINARKGDISKKGIKLRNKVYKELQQNLKNRMFKKLINNLKYIKFSFKKLQIRYNFFLPLILNNNYFFSFKPIKNVFKLHKYFLYASRFLPTLLWRSAYYGFYRFKKKKPWVRNDRKWRIWWKERFKESKVLPLYYGFLTQKKYFFLKKYFFKKKYFNLSSIFYIEKLLINILKKLNFFRKFRQLYIFIKTYGVLINNKKIKNPYFYVQKNKIISFDLILKQKLLKLFFNNFKNNHFVVATWPAYLEFNLKLLKIVLWREPVKSELNLFISNYYNNLSAL